MFSRFNFSAEPPAGEVSVEATTTFAFADPQHVKVREFQGRLVTGKPAAERVRIAARIRLMNADVLTVQRVEDVDTLTRFARRSWRPGLPGSSCWRRATTRG